MLWSIRDGPRLIDKKIFRGFSLSAVRECSRQTAKSTRRKSNRIHQLLTTHDYTHLLTLAGFFSFLRRSASSRSA